MAQAFKWDYKARKYTPHKIPDEWKCPLFCADMDAPVNCASCGKGMTYGDGYTSRVIHTAAGFGYFVCEECMKTEMAAERAARKEQTE